MGNKLFNQYLENTDRLKGESGVEATIVTDLDNYGGTNIGRDDLNVALGNDNTVNSMRAGINIKLKNFLLYIKNKMSVYFWLKTESLERHLTGTTTTKPPSTGWTLDLDTPYDTAPGGGEDYGFFVNGLINLWKYQLPTNCHILRISPDRLTYTHVADDHVAALAGAKPILYKILPPSGVYDGYELIIDINCQDTAPQSGKAKTFGVLGQFPITSDNTVYSGNIIFSSVKTEAITMGDMVGSETSIKVQGSEGQFVCIASNNLGNFPSSFTYTQTSLNIKLRWRANLARWVEEGISQPFIY